MFQINNNELEVKNSSLNRILFMDLLFILRNNPQLKSLVLININLDFNKTQLLFAALKTTIGLTKISLANNPLEDEVSSLIEALLLRQPNLKIIHLSNTNIGKDCAKVIANFLSKNSTLHELNLEHTKITEPDGINLLMPLFTQTTLYELKISGNQLSPYLSSLLSRPFVAHENYMNYEPIEIRDVNLIKQLAALAHDNSIIKKQLWDSIYASRHHPKLAPLAACAITVLNFLGETFSDMDLKGIRIPGANLYGAIMDATDLSNADLRKANLGGAWLCNAKFNGALVQGVDWGNYIILKNKKNTNFYSNYYYSGDKKYLIEEIHGKVKLYGSNNYNLISEYSYKGKYLDKDTDLKGRSNDMKFIYYRNRGGMILII